MPSRSAGAALARGGGAAHAGEPLDLPRIELELRRRGANLVPGVVVDRDAVLLALRARIALGFAGNAQPVEARGRGRLAQRGEECRGLLLENAFLKTARVDQDGEHAVPHPPLGAIAALVLGAAAGERAA